MSTQENTEETEEELNYSGCPAVGAIIRNTIILKREECVSGAGRHRH